MALTRPKPQAFIWLAGLLAFFIYLLTLAPSITWRNQGADSGDLAAAVAVGGVPHPPGYPTYLLLADLFKPLLWGGDVAYRLNLLSASSAALAVTVTGLLIYQTLHAARPKSSETSAVFAPVWAAVAAALTLAFSRLLWSQAVIAEVYALHTLLAALLLLLAFQLTPANQGWLGPGVVGLLGLSLGNHPSIILLTPLLLAALSRLRWNGRLIISCGFAFLLGLSVYVVIPYRAAQMPPVNWGVADSWSGFTWLVTAQPYRQYLFSLPWEFIPTRLGSLAYLLAQTFLGWGVPAGLAGWLRLMRHHRPLGYGSLISFLLIGAFALGYNTTDSYLYLLPAMVIFSMWVGWGLTGLVSALPARFQRQWLLTGLSMGLLPGLSLWLNFSGQDLSQDYEALAYAQQRLDSAAPRAVIVTENDPDTFALWYGRYGLGLRPDVAIVNKNLWPYAWYQKSLYRTHPHLPLITPEQLFDESPTFFQSKLFPAPIHHIAEGNSETQRDYPLPE